MIASCIQRFRAIYILAMCAVAALFFAPVLHMGLAEHDVQTFRDNARISEEFSFFFSPDKEQLTGRPVAEFAKWLASLAFGDDPVLFHALVIALHLGASLLLVALLRQLGSNRTIAGLSGLLFLIHVGHFYAVYHISALEYPLSLVWTFLGLICWLRFDQSTSKLTLVGAYSSFVLGVLSHVAVIAVLPFCAYWAYQVGHERKKILRQLAPLSAVLVGLTAFALSVTSRSASTWKSLDYFDWGLGGIVDQFIWMLGKLFTTSHVLLPFWHDRAVWEFYLGGLVSIGLLALIYKKVFPAAIWGVWMLASLLPFALVEDHSVVGWPEVLSRYLYHASVGSSVFIAWGIAHWVERWGGKALMVTCIGGLLITSFIGMRELDNYFLYRSGFYLWVNGDSKAGIERARRAVEGATDTLPLGSMYFRLGNMVLADGGEAWPLLERASAAVPGDDRIRAMQLAVHSLDSDVGRAQQAREEIQLSWRRSQEDGDAVSGRFNGMMATIYRSIGHGYSVKEEWETAVAAYDLSTTFSAYGGDDPPQAVHHTQALNGAGIELAQQGSFDRALEYFRRSHAIMPNVTAHYNEGLIYEILGDMNAAIGAYKQALSTEPQRVEVLTRLGVVLTLEGFRDQAVECFQQALSIQPDYAPAIQNLSALRSAE